MDDQPEKQGKVPGWIFLVLGVVFPFLVLILELATRICAMDIFDPVPTIPHALIVAFVPLSNFLVWLSVRNGTRLTLKQLGIMNGFAIGVAFYYSLLFVPIYPFAAIGILWGIGILPFAPLLSLVFAIKGHLYLRKTHSIAKIPGTILGVVLFLVVLIVIELPVTVTRVGMKLATSPDPETRLTAVKWLRTIGNEDLMLRACYLRTGRTVDLASVLLFLGDPMRPENAQQIFYRVTGTPYNSVPPPSVIQGRGGILMTRDFDLGQGGSLVAGQVRGLSLESSRIDSSVDSDAVLAYFEWILEFKNSTVRPQEARAQIALPAGGVVSRLTLWVNGEEKEAAFAARGKVREAYERVVRKQRDPALVTTSGLDRIQLQCFPVPADGGTMKLRIGITAPLTMFDSGKAFLTLPKFLERNFSIGEEKKHLIWIEARADMKARIKSMIEDRPSEGVQAIRGELTDPEIRSLDSIIEIKRNPQIVKSWAIDETAQDKGIVLQSIRDMSAERPDRVVLVIDGSSSMSEYSPRISPALRSLPENIPLSIVVASDQPMEIMASSRSEAEKKLGDIRYVGGQDNVPALVRAWELLSRTRNGVIVWVHGPQPVLMESVESLLQRYSRHSRQYGIYSVEAIPGPNRIMEKLESERFFHVVPRVGDFREDLERLFLSWQENSVRPSVHREKADKPSGDENDGKKTSVHLVRLWANSEVLRLASSKKLEDKQKAAEIGALYHLVTPVTGAVVLESAEQFKDAGLTPVPVSQVPVIPEPEFWMLMAVVFVALAWLIMRSRRGRSEA
ncbi:MAG: hypothetical protein HY912_05175 [Desulfomonile tiedjei]|uniref:VIT domain-containing protein n=1 Tax=Desulfomonile tiedjei TaxID=2358 RepID=A0A9D6Z567_9BACT|nr:hypothetical protein [Desulfomonile tiedjei]